jgi:hypothetical protein
VAAKVIAISIPIPLITIGWIAACILIGLLAGAQGRSFVSWSLAAAIASPIVVLLLFILPKPKQTRQPPATPKAVAPTAARLSVEASNTSFITPRQVRLAELAQATFLSTMIHLS